MKPVLVPDLRNQGTSEYCRSPALILDALCFRTGQVGDGGLYGDIAPKAVSRLTNGSTASCCGVVAGMESTWEHFGQRTCLPRKFPGTANDCPHPHLTVSELGGVDACTMRTELQLGQRTRLPARSLRIVRRLPQTQSIDSVFMKPRIGCCIRRTNCDLSDGQARKKAQLLS